MVHEVRRTIGCFAHPAILSLSANLSLRARATPAQLTGASLTDAAVREIAALIVALVPAGDVREQAALILGSGPPLVPVAGVAVPDGGIVLDGHGGSPRAADRHGVAGAPG